MTAKEKVKDKYPFAHSEKHLNGRIKGMQTRYYLIWSRRSGEDKQRLGEGDTESKAWTNAKLNLGL